MKTKSAIKVLTTGFYSVVAVLFVAVVVSWWVDYPHWLDQLISNSLMVALGIVLLVKAYQIRGKESKVAAFYLICGIASVAVAFLSPTFVKLIAIVGVVTYVITNQRVKKAIKNKETIHEQQ